MPLYRLANPANGDHFYTTSNKEHDNAVAQFGYHLEGAGGYVYQRQIPSARSPPLRLFHGGTNDHFYTISDTESANANAKFSYTYEGIAC